MKLKSIRFRSDDGVENQVKLCVPRNSQTMVLCVPAMGDEMDTSPYGIDVPE